MFITEIHSKFIEDFFEASKLFSNSKFSAIPTFLFLISSFMLIYDQFKQHADSFLKWHKRILRGFVFHWTIFYITRVWFAILRIFKWSVDYADDNIQVKTRKNTDLYYNKLAAYSTIFLIESILSLLPLVAFLGLKYARRPRLPDFFLLVAEDPWSRSEIGTAGHYLERPIRVRNEISQGIKYNMAFRFGRSCSVDTGIGHQPKIIRSCRSALNIKASNIEEFASDVLD